MKTTNIFYRAMCLVLMALCSVCGFAQSEFEVLRPDIHAQQFLSAVSTDVALHTGQLSVNIPLVNLPGKGIDIPVSLSFNGGNVSHNTEASSVGLGWSLLAGGVITSIVDGDNDLDMTSRDEAPWQYQADYIRNKHAEAFASPSIGSNIMSGALNQINALGNPDSYYYSFLGYSGEIDLSLDHNDVRKCVLYPDTDFKLVKTTDGFKVTDIHGIQYYFEDVATGTRSNLNIVKNSWFLSRIITPQGGTVTFTYEDEDYIDLRNEHDNMYFNRIYTKRITRIDSDYGYVVFNGVSRGDLPGTKRITSIEQFDADGNLLKGYTLNMSTYFDNTNKASTNHYNTRMGLTSIQEYGSDRTTLPATTFDYLYAFNRSKNTYRSYSAYGINPRGSWASCPGWLTGVDRNISGNPACWLSNPNSPMEYINGYTTVYDDYDDTVDDYFVLSRIIHPTGATESFSYGKHDYSMIGSSNEIVTSSGESVSGRRLQSRTVTDHLGNLQITNYVYKRHSQDYNAPSDTLSSGVLVIPSVHTTMMYRPVSAGAGGQDRFEAFPYTTDKPQNNLTGSPVCYTEVEEYLFTPPSTILERTIHYFDRTVVYPGTNYIYVTDDFIFGDDSGLLVTLQNTFYGTLDSYPAGLESYSTMHCSYLNFPMGPLHYPSNISGKVKKRIHLDSYGRIVRKEENNYSIQTNNVRYAYTVCRFNESPSPSTYPQQYRYLVNASTCPIQYSRLNKRIITDYLSSEGGVPIDSVCTIHEYTYDGNRIRIEQQTSDNGTIIRKENIYPDNVSFDTSTSLSSQAAALKRLVTDNIISTPIQTVVKRNGIYTDGTFRTHKIVNSRVVTDSVFLLRTGAAAYSVTTGVNSSGKLIRHGNFDFEQCYPYYDSSLNPLSADFRTQADATIYRGYDNRYIVAVINGCSYSQLQANTTLKQQLALLETFNINTESGRNALKTCNATIRSALPAGMTIVTYTWNPDRGITSETDALGDTTYFEYDSFGRLATVRNADWQVEESHDYHFKQ